MCVQTSLSLRLAAFIITYFWCWFWKLMTRYFWVSMAHGFVSYRRLSMGAVQWSKVKNGSLQNGLGIKSRTKNLDTCKSLSIFPERTNHNLASIFANTWTSPQILHCIEHLHSHSIIIISITFTAKRMNHRILRKQWLVYSQWLVEIANAYDNPKTNWKYILWVSL